MKTCSICKESKPKTLDNFHMNGKYFGSYCKLCEKKKRREVYAKTRNQSVEYTREYRARNKNRIKSRDSEPEVRERAYFNFIKRKYGLTKEDYEKLWLNQHGVCKICQTPLQEWRGERRTAVVDHCHDTGEVRGILCNKCNVGIGQFSDNPDLLLLACDYLLDFQEMKEIIKKGLA